MKKKSEDSCIGNIYKWGSWDDGWMGNEIVVDIDKKYVYLKSIYKEKDIVFIKKNVKPIEKGWFIKINDSTKLTHKEFERKLKITYSFVEKLEKF